MARHCLKAGLLILAVVAGAVAPAAAQTASSLISIAVPPAQALEGRTTVVIPDGAVQRGQLVVKSNTDWTLVVSFSGQTGDVAWRTGSGAWIEITSASPLLQGGRGVHVITYEARAKVTAQPVVLTFALRPQ